MRLGITAAVLALSLAANLAQHWKIDKMDRLMQATDSVIVQSDILLHQCQERLSPVWGRPL